MSLLSSWLRLGGPTAKTDPCPCASHDSLAIVEKAEILHEQLLEARAEKVQWLVQTIVEPHSNLLELPHYRPGKAINHLLGNLVSVCSEIHDRDIVDKVTSLLDSPLMLIPGQRLTSTSRSSPTQASKQSCRPSARSAPKLSRASSYIGPSSSCPLRPKPPTRSTPVYKPSPTTPTMKSSPASSSAPSSRPPKPLPAGWPSSARVRCRSRPSACSSPSNRTLSPPPSQHQPSTRQQQRQTP